MLNEHSGPDFKLALGAVPQDLLVDALRRGYETACEHHDPARGADEVTFGFCLYKYCVHEIAGAAAIHKDVLAVTSRHPTFRFSSGGFELACHRVGWSEHNDISECFPGNDGAVLRMIEEQLWLPNLPRAQALSDARRVVLAHLGNADDGLRAVYFCIAEHSKDGHISAWAYSQLVWRADAEIAVPTTTGVVERAPVEHVESPMVLRRTSKASDDKNG